MTKEGKAKRVFTLAADDIAAFFPYFFGFYLIALFLSLFFPAWQGFFYWPAFHAGVVMFGVMSWWSGRARSFRERVAAMFRVGAEVGKSASSDITRSGIGVAQQIVWRISQRIGDIAKVAVLVAAKLFHLYLKKAIRFQKGLRRKDYVRGAIVATILMTSLFFNADPIDFFVLAFGLVSVLFRLDMRIAAAGALAFLVAAPTALIFNQDAAGEVFAVYAYYFLVIAVATGVSEQIKLSTA